MSNRYRSAFVLFLAVAALTVTGCAGEDHGHAEEAATPAAPAETTVAVDEIVISEANMEAVQAVLMAADGLDGAEDGVVAKCPGCALMMEGSADHAVTVADHELHFCSDSCRDRFAGNAEEALVALQIPAH